MEQKIGSSSRKAWVMHNKQTKNKPWDEQDIEQAFEDWYENIMFNARTGDVYKGF